MKMKVECPECGREAVVYDKQIAFVCVDDTGCGYMCDVDELPDVEKKQDRMICSVDGESDCHAGGACSSCYLGTGGVVGKKPKRWILVDFDECPNCGDDAEILTNSDDQERFFDGDDARCCQECGQVGYFSADSEQGYINWLDS